MSEIIDLAGNKIAGEPIPATPEEVQKAEDGYQYWADRMMKHVFKLATKNNQLEIEQAHIKMSELLFWVNAAKSRS